MQHFVTHWFFFTEIIELKYSLNKYNNIFRLLKSYERGRRLSLSSSKTSSMRRQVRRAPSCSPKPHSWRSLRPVGAGTAQATAWWSNTSSRRSYRCAHAIAPAPLAITRLTATAPLHTGGGLVQPKHRQQSDSLIAKSTWQSINRSANDHRPFYFLHLLRYVTRYGTVPLAVLCPWGRL